MVKKKRKTKRARERERVCGSKLLRSIEFFIQKKKKKIIFDSNLNRNFEK